MACSHDHTPTLSPAAITFAIVLNALFVIAQVYYGLASHSLSLLADAGHNFGDLLGIILAGVAIWASALRPTRTYTYGLKSATILAALANSLLLILTVIELVHASVDRFLSSELVQPNTTIVIAVAIVAVFVNGFTAWLLHKGDQNDLNIRGMYLHILSDAGISAGVIAGAVVMHFVEAPWIDPVLSLLIAVAILYATWQLLRRTLRLALQGIPYGVDIAQVERALRALPGVTDVHDLHIWALGTNATALSAHLTLPSGSPGDEFLAQAKSTLKSLGVDHPTLQLERAPHRDCGCC